MAAATINLAAGQAPATTAALLERAAQAEAALRFDAAAAQLYQVVVERPRSPEAWPARARLAQLLALAGDMPGALLQCQALRAETPAEHQMRQPALDLASTLARRIRTASTDSFLPNVRNLPVRGFPDIDEVTTIAAHASGTWLAVDSGKGCAYRIAGESATPVGCAEEVSAAAFLADGTIALAGKNGITVSAAKPVRFTGAWGGRKREVKKVRSMAALSTGDLLVVDKDFDGVLRCAVASATCAPWGPPVKMRAVRVGPSDFVVLLDDRQESVRVFDSTGRQLAAAGPMVGGVKLEEIADAAIDGAYGVYLLDKNTKRVHVVALRSAMGGAAAAGSPTRAASLPLTTERIGQIVIPADGDRAVKNPSAVGLMNDGTVIVAGKGLPRLVRFQ